MMKMMSHVEAGLNIRSHFDEEELELVRQLEVSERQHAKV